MNIQSSNVKVAVKAPSPAGNSEKEKIEEPVSAEPQDVYSINISIPKYLVSTSGKALRQAARVIPGTVNLALNAPTIMVSPILNAISPAEYRADQVSYERWTNVLGTGAIGAIAGAIAGGAAGQALQGAVAGAMIGGFVGGTRNVLGMIVNQTGEDKPKYPQVGRVASEAKPREFSYYTGRQQVKTLRTPVENAAATGKALRQGYATIVKEAYLEGGQYADKTVAFLRGLGGFDGQ